MSGSTWNPLLGCKEVSPGCKNCYSARLIGTRFSKNPKLPMYHDIATTAANGHPHFTGTRRMVPDRLDEPLRTRKGRKVFVNDMGDLFYEGHPFEDIAAVFGVMAAAKQHTFQVLTKRPERAVEFFAWIETEAKREALAEPKGSAWWRVLFVLSKIPNDIRTPEVMHGDTTWPLPNVWIGTSVEDQKSADTRIPHLLRVPAVVWFLSMEPLLEAVDLCRIDAFRGAEWPASLPGEPRTHYDSLRGSGLRPSWTGVSVETHGGPTINWIIIGGESGPNARPFRLPWLRSLLEQADAAGVPSFVKQYGSKPQDFFLDMGSEYGGIDSSDFYPVKLKDSHGGDESEWAAEFQGRRAFPKVAS
ncbi:MAG TPA: DUF5131 family protein [Polyangiaceae bacterium]